MEWKLFKGDVPHVSTFAYHEHRERAPHAEQPVHQPRMQLALEFVLRCEPRTVMDLGCGDGGFVQMLSDQLPYSTVVGYDFAPANEAGWAERGVEDQCVGLNVFPAPPGPVINSDIEFWAEHTDVVVMTEILEHLARPHEALKAIQSRYIVVSSPHNEDSRSHDECHAWAWDMDGYRVLVEAAGFDILDHRQAGFSQVILAKSRR